MDNPILKIDKLSFLFSSSLVLNELTLSLQSGEIAALIGSSGAGKTTLFKMITGLLPSNQGSISIAGSLVHPKCQQVAYMTQEDLLLPWRTVLKNLTLTSELGKRSIPRQQLHREALELLSEVGLAGYENAYPDELSGGMRQRVSLARALLLKRPLLLLDEPFGSLDVILREQMYALLKQIRLRFGTTILLITHDFRDALNLAERIFLLAQGKICREWNELSALQNDRSSLGVIEDEMRLGLEAHR
jgi:NitT/TauT family transport system ATP-binding protein